MERIRQYHTIYGCRYSDQSVHDDISRLSAVKTGSALARRHYVFYHSYDVFQRRFDSNVSPCEKSGDGEYDVGTHHTGSYCYL